MGDLWGIDEPDARNLILAQDIIRGRLHEERVLCRRRDEARCLDMLANALCRGADFHSGQLSEACNCCDEALAILKANVGDRHEASFKEKWVIT